MKKSVKITLIVAAALVGLGLCLSAAGFAMGGRLGDLRGVRLDPATGKWEVVSTAEPDAKGDYTGSTVIIPAEGVDTLDIEWIQGDVHVLLTSGDEITVTETVHGLTLGDYAMVVEGGKALTIRYTSDTWLNLTNLPEKDLTVRLPRSVAEELLAVHLSGVSADFDIPALTVWDTFTFDSTSGDLETGWIGGDNARAELNTVSGEIALDGSFREIQGGSTSGEFDLTLRGMPSQTDLTTVSGDVSLEISGDIQGFRLTYDTVSGDMEYDIPLMQDRDGAYVFGSGGGVITVDTTSGGLKLEAID